MDNSVIDLEKVNEILEDGIDRAKEILDDNSELNELLTSVQTLIDTVPMLKSSLENVQSLFALIKSYAKQEYTEISPKVIAVVVSAFIYLIKKKDLIKDSIPVLGWLDDIAVMAVALKAIEPDLKAYEQWRQEQAEK